MALPTTTITPAQARRHLLTHLGLQQPFGGDISALLAERRCIQLDPLDRIGNSADLFVAARMDGTRRGDAYRALLPGGCFEHMFKVRCLLPPTFLPHYRKELRATGWFPYQKMCARPDDEALAAVLAEVRERGPLRQRDLSDRGMATKRYDHPWARKATLNMISVDVLEARCDLVVVGRTTQGKVYDLAERAFSDVALEEPTESWASFVVRERTIAAGLLSLNAGPWWALAKEVRVAARRDASLQKSVEMVQVEGLSRRHLAPRGFLTQPEVADDGQMRVLGPLDPLLWDRDLVRHLWDFDYVWEVYKPASKRRWGYYVCPLLHRGRLVGRFEAHREADERGNSKVVVDQLWPEAGFEPDEFDDCIDRLGQAQ